MGVSIPLPRRCERRALPIAPIPQVLVKPRASVGTRTRLLCLEGRDTTPVLRMQSLVRIVFGIIWLTPRRFDLVLVQNSKLSSYGHTRVNAPHPIRTAKLSTLGPNQYYGRGLRGNLRCCMATSILFCPYLTNLPLLNTLCPYLTQFILP